MERLCALIEDEIAKREDVYDDRSESWQESEKGELYMERTEMLQELYDTLTDWPDEFKAE